MDFLEYWQYWLNRPWPDFAAAFFGQPIVALLATYVVRNYQKKCKEKFFDRNHVRQKK